MNTHFFACLLVFGHLGAFTFAQAAPCEYEVDAKSVQIVWTAFKTSQKVGVNGTFPNATIRGNLTQRAEFKKFLSQLEAEIKVSGPEQFHTGNPAREQTIYEHFFRHLKKSGKVLGSIRKVKGDALSGEFELLLNMNERKKPVALRYTRDPKNGAFEAKGTIDLIEFSLGKALKDLNQACQALHQGADGVSKTWSTVDLKLAATISEKCDS